MYILLVFAIFLDDSPNGEYVDLTLNPERFTGYSGKSSNNIWANIYQNNCFMYFYIFYIFYLGMIKKFAMQRKSFKGLSLVFILVLLFILSMNFLLVLHF